MRKQITFLVALCMSIAFITGCSNNNSVSTSQSSSSSQQVEEKDNSIFDGGLGTKEDPYQISNIDTLKEFAKTVNDGSQNGYADTFIKLTSDIDLDGVKWTPIGNTDDMEKGTTMFNGTFDGDNHIISNLKYESDKYHCGVGLFGLSSGEIKNLEVKNATVKITEEKSVAIAAVAGYNMGKVENVKLSGDCTITGNNCTGGIIGGNKGVVSNCTVDNATIVVIGDNKFKDNKIVQVDVAECGGLIIGGGFGGTIDNCTAKGTVKAEGNEPVGMGGIGGCLEMMDSITNCTVDVNIESKNGGHAIGGICGYAGTHSNKDICLETEGFSTKNYPSIIENCKATIKIDAKDATHVGGIVGTGLYYYGEETTFKIINSSVSGTIDGAITPGTIAGRAEGSTIKDCKSDVKIDGQKSIEQIGKTSCMYESADQ